MPSISEVDNPLVNKNLYGQEISIQNVEAASSSTKTNSSAVSIKGGNSYKNYDCKNNNGDLPSEKDDVDIYCGFPSYIKLPSWVNRLATKQTFLAVFCMSTVLQGMYYTYFVSVLTTIERLFQIKSQTTGFIMSSTEIGQIFGGLLLSYYGGTGHRPRWIASGLLLFGFSALLSALPHFLFGDAMLKEFLRSTPSSKNLLETANICRSPIINGSLVSSMKDDVFNILEKDCQSIEGGFSRYVLLLLFVALLGVGIGQTAVYNLGIPYIDDNVSSTETPTYFGTTLGVRIFGPTFGFILGSVCTRLPNDPFSETEYTPNDPRWIGAWWLGHVIISGSLILISMIMIMFPKRLPTPEERKRFQRETPNLNGGINLELLKNGINGIVTKSSYDLTSLPQTTENALYRNSFHCDNGKPDCLSNESTNLNRNTENSHSERRNELALPKNNLESMCVEDSRKPKVDGFFETVRRLLKNRILVLRIASSVLHLLPIAGFYTFLPKFLEVQFRIPPHWAALVSGVGGIFVMGFGIFFSGFALRRINPSARSIAGWIAIVTFLYSFGMVILIQIECSDNEISGLMEYKGEMKFAPMCERNCTLCNDNIYTPVCSSEGKSYFSPCQIGCREVNFINGTEDIIFSDCECLEEGVTAKLSPCNLSQCIGLYWYVTIFGIMVFIYSTSEVTGMLFTLRCVDTNDKAMALGLISVAVGLFGNVPCPILYGSVVDSACIHWREACDGTGACQVYDDEKFRKYFHGLTGFLMLVGCLVDVTIWILTKNDNFKCQNAGSFDNISSKNPSGSHTTSTSTHTNKRVDNGVTPLLNQNEVKIEFCNREANLGNKAGQNCDSGNLKVGNVFEDFPAVDSSLE